MTIETTSLSPWDRALIAARWCRDKAAGFIASFWLYVILWAVIGIAFSVLLYIDGKFSRGLAEGLEEIDPVSFQAMGWAYRLFAAVFLMAAARCIYKDVKGALTFRLLGLFASVIVCLHAFGFGFQALQDRRDDAMAVQEVVAIQADNSREQIVLLTGQIDRIRQDRDAQVQRLQASIDGIVNDGLNNDQLADAYRLDQTRVEDTASASVATLEAKITELATNGNEARQTVTTTLAEAKPWPALYIGMAQLFTWSKEPSDWIIYLCGVGFIVAWVLLAESLVIFLPERVYLMHLRDADKGEFEIRESDDIPAGQTVWRGTDEEWAEIEAALQVHRNVKAGAKKGATTRRRGSKIEAADSYYRNRISTFLLQHAEGMSTAQIAAQAGLTVSSLRMSYGPHMEPEEMDLLFGTSYVPGPEAEPPIAGTGEPISTPEPEVADEPEAPSEPVVDEPEPETPPSYGVAVYDPEAANDADKKDDAA